MEPLPPKPPLPRWFWFTLGLLVVAMFTSLVAAVLLPRPVATKLAPIALVPGHHPFPARSIPSPSTVATEFPDQLEPLIHPVSTPTDTNAPFAAIPPPNTDTSASPTDIQPTLKRYQSNSKAAEYANVRGPKLAILIDDMGLAPAESRQALELPKGVSYSFFSFGPSSDELARQAFENGHEILIHVPMEPLPHKQYKFNPGPDTLEVGDAPDVIVAKLSHHLMGLGDIAVGINNHMGSRFTSWPEGMRVVLQQIDTQGYLFLDSLTITPTATRGAAQGLGLPVLKRDVFLDHDDNPEAINQQLDKAVALAQKQGFAIAIAHPLPNTLAVLESRLPLLTSVTLVPITAALQNK